MELAWAPRDRKPSQLDHGGPLTSAMGHHWSEDMRCRCGAEWWTHQTDPKPCLDTARSRPDPHRDEIYRAGGRG